MTGLVSVQHFQNLDDDSNLTDIISDFCVTYSDYFALINKKMYKRRSVFYRLTDHQ